MYLQNIFDILKPSNKIAVFDYTTNQSITYGELVERSTSISKTLNKNQLVKIETEDTINLIVNLFAAFKAKAIFNFSKNQNIKSVNDSVAYIMNTSGTTGEPKYFQYTHDKVCKILENTCARIPKDKDNVLIISSLSHMNGLSNLLISFYCNHTVYIAKKFDIQSIKTCIEKNTITKITTVPSVFEYLTRENIKSECVKNIRVGSSLCNKNLISRIKTCFPKATVFNAYGISEIGPGLFGYHPKGISIPDGSVGYPLPNYEYKIVNGVLQIKTPFMSEFYNTNDLFSVDPNGFYYCHGRNDDIFKCGGYTINPIEIETEIEKIPGVKQAVVIPVRDELKENKPICILAGEVDLESINTLLTIENYKKPRKYIKVESIPLNNSGKVDRKQLKRDYG